jgi:transcriptional regulator with XRE-family HTH domain
MRAVLARKFIRARREVGLSQEELAQRARVRVNSIRRLESGLDSLGVRVVDKIDRALKDAGATEPSGL